MHTVLQQLILDHKNLRALLDVLQSQLDNFHNSCECDLVMMRELMEYIKSYEYQIHHPTEDCIFARLKTFNTTDMVLIDKLQQQHQTLMGMTHVFLNTIDAVVHEDVIPRQTLEDEGYALLEMLRNHVEIEEREVFVMADSLLQPIDWLQLEMVMPKACDTIPGYSNLGGLRSLLRHLTST